MREEEIFYNDAAELEYVEYEGNRFLIDNGILKDVIVEYGIVKIPDKVREIRRQAFLNARLETRMEALFVPPSVRKIEKLTFSGMPSLKQVVLQASIVILKQGMFRNCMELEQIFLPDTLRTIESRAFENCIRLQKVILPRVWVQISEDAFLKCVNLKDERIERAVEDACYQRKKEEEEARKARFPHLFEEETARIPEEGETEKPQRQEVSEAKKATEQTPAVPAIETSSEAHYCIRDGVLERCEVYGRRFQIPEGVTALADRVFFGMSQLEEIEFPSSLSAIGARALEGTAWLKKEQEKNSYVVVNGILVSACYDSIVPEAKLPDSIHRIAPYAFFRSGAQVVILPESVKEVDAFAFVDSDVTEIDFSQREDVILHAPVAVRCNQLRELYFQGKLERIGAGFVEDCPALKRVCLKWAQTVVSKEAFSDNVRLWVI